MFEYVFIAFVAIFCIQFIYYFFVFGSFAFTKHKAPKNEFNNPISVIICAKNEAKNLKKNLPYFINQSYRNFELVLINDASHDQTLKVMEQFKNKSNIPIKIVDVKPNEQFWGSKKYALTLGIKAATNEHLLFSDADCKPASENWISEMSKHFNNKIIILGFGAYAKIKNSFLNKIIRFETILTAIQYFSYAKIGIPYMGVGRNLAYTKSLFFKANGFSNHIKIKSGDDDLFVNQNANKQNTAICYTKNSFTSSLPKTTFKNWIQQKSRHVSTASHYKFGHKFLLGLFYVSQLFFWILSSILLVLQFNWIIVLSIVLFRFLMQYIALGFSIKKLNETDLIVWIPFFEIFLIFIQLFIFIKNLISKPTNW